MKSNHSISQWLIILSMAMLSACGGGKHKTGNENANHLSSRALFSSIANHSQSPQASASAASASTAADGPVASSLAQSANSSSAAVSTVVLSSLATQSSTAAVLESLAVKVDRSDLLVAETAQASVLATYSDGSVEPIDDASYTSSDDTVAAIDGAGKIVARRAGKAKITAAKENLEGFVDVQVKEQPQVLQGINITCPEASAFVKGSQWSVTVTADYNNAEDIVIANSEVTFSSDHPQIVSVNNGVLSALALGNAIITATYKTEVTKCSLAVTAPAITFHFLKPPSWNSTIKAHWFTYKDEAAPARPSTFPGTAMQDVDGDGWYDISLQGLDQINIVFNDGGAQSAGFHQTADQWARRGGWFVPDEFPNRAGKYYGTWYDAEPRLSPQPVCDVKYYGAKGDGVTKDTQAIQKAIDDCAGKKGIVRLREGKFLSGMIVLKSDITLRIEPSATLLANRNAKDFPQQPKFSGNSQYLNCRRAFIYAQGAKNIRIDGGGIIDGNGGKQSPWAGGKEETRPMAIFLGQTDGIVIQNITIKNSAMWTLVPFESSNVLIRGVTIQSLDGKNLDGIDPVDVHHLLIEDVDVASQDDSICLKSGSRRGTMDVLVRNSRIRQSLVANGLKFGTATVGPFKDITFENISVENVHRAAMAVESVDGSAVSNVLFRNIDINNAGTPFYMVLGDRGASSAATTNNVGSIEKVQFENITAKNMSQTWGSFMSGIRVGNKTYYLRDLLFKNVDLTFKGGSRNFAAQPEYNSLFREEYPDPGDSRIKKLDGSGNEDLNKKDMPGYLFFRHIDNLTLNNVKVRVSPADRRPLIVREDVPNVTIN